MCTVVCDRRLCASLLHRWLCKRSRKKEKRLFRPTHSRSSEKYLNEFSDFFFDLLCLREYFSDLENSLIYLFAVLSKVSLISADKAWALARKKHPKFSLKWNFYFCCCVRVQSENFNAHFPPKNKSSARKKWKVSHGKVTKCRPSRCILIRWNSLKFSQTERVESVELKINQLQAKKVKNSARKLSFL